MRTTYFALITFICFICPFTSFAQEPIAYVMGSVADTSGERLFGVSISVIGTTYSTTSDSAGEYTLLVPAEKNIDLAFSYIGFVTQKYALQLKNGDKKKLSVKIHPSSTQLKEFTIQDEQMRGSTLTRIDPKYITNMPNASGSFEAILKTMPGVASSNELSSQYSVRGGNFDENLVYVNDIEIYRPFLVRSGQQEGLSFINSDMVSSILFSAGGFDAKYGDKMSSVLDIQYRKPTKFSVTAGLSLLGASLQLEDKIKNFTYMIGYRQKSNQYLLNTFDTKGDYKPFFQDLQLYTTYEMNKKHQLDFLGNYSRNVYNVIPQTQETSFGTINEALKLTVYFDGQETDSYGSMMGGLAYTYKPSDSLKLKFIGSAYHTNEDETFDIQGQYYLDELERDLGSSNFGKVSYNLGVGTFHNHARNYLNADVINLEHKGSYALKKQYLQWGIKAQHEKINDKLSEWNMLDSAGYSIPKPQSYFYPENSQNPITFPGRIKTENNVESNRYNAYIQNSFGLGDSIPVMITAGIRAQYWELNTQFIISPRASISYKPRWKKDYVFRAAAGVYSQPPFYRELRDLDGVINTQIKSQQSIHFVLGSDHNFQAWNRPFKYVTELYYKYLYDIIPYKIDNVRIRYLGKNEAIGYAAGIDMRINGEFVKGVESWASLSFMKTEENLTNDYYYNYSDSTGERINPYSTKYTGRIDSSRIEPGFIPRPADQRVIFGLFFQDYLPKFPTYKMNLTLQFATGLPFGPPGKDRYKDILRMPPYRRVDIGFSKQIIGENVKNPPHLKVLKHFHSIWIGVEVFNLLQVDNTISYFWISDIRNRKYAVPSYLTQRQINVRLQIKF